MKNGNPIIPELIKTWQTRVSNNATPESMTELYEPNAVLLATYESFLVGLKEIKGYFKEFLDKKNLKCEIIENLTKTDKVTKAQIANGIYIFSFTDEKGVYTRVFDRYTFVVFNNKIITHHSSVNPE